VSITGHTDPGLTLTPTQTGATTVADENGLFTFTNVPLAAGQNPVTITTTDASGNVVTLSQSFPRPSVDAAPPTPSPSLVNAAAPALLAPIVVNAGRAQRSHIDTIDIPFGEDVSATTTLADLVLLRNGSQVVSLAGATLTAVGNHLVLDLRGVALPDGDYVLK